MPKSHIALALLAALAAGVLFVTYGTVLPSFPFASVQLDRPTAVASDGEFTCVVDAESQRALILNADGDLTGTVSCSTVDSPFDAITDVNVSDKLVYLSGVRFQPDSDNIQRERVAVYDKGGNLLGAIFEKPGSGDSIPRIKSLSEVPDGIAIAYEKDVDPNEGEDQRENLVDDTGAGESQVRDKSISFLFPDGEEIRELEATAKSDVAMYGAAFAKGERSHYATLSIRGIIGDDGNGLSSQMYAGHVFTAIDVAGDGTLYACDDQSGDLYAIPLGSSDARTLVAGDGFHSVHENSGVISLCNEETNMVTICDTAGTVTSEFDMVKPSIGFSARMVLVWASGLYLVVLALVLVVRKTHRLVKDGKTDSIGPMLMAVAVAAAFAIAIGSFSYSSYQKMLELRANEINTCADYLKTCAPELSAAMEKADNRDALHGDEDKLAEAVANFIEVASPAFLLVDAANNNNIGMYCTVYGKDDRGVFYLYGSSAEYVMGTSARDAESNGIQAAFEGSATEGGELLHGKTLRDAAQYRLVQIPTTDRKGVAGVIEIGSKMRSFESSITGDLAQRILGLLVLVLVVYLTYSELRACGRCLFSYRKRQGEEGVRAVAVLTRPFTFVITMLTSIDSVMTVLIARDLLTRAGMGDSSPLLAVPAVMLGIGMIAGQGLYAVAGSRVGLRKLVIAGAFVMLACACFTGAAVSSGVFWLYCVAKLAMSVPFGMLYSLGYSLPRLANNDETRALAAGGVKRTDTSAAALGTVLGGYAAQALGNMWVYALVGVACLPIILMALNLLPRGMQPLEKLAHSDGGTGRILSFVKTPVALGLALFVILPATLATGYASFLFPLFSVDLGLSKADINSIVVLGQVVVYVCINTIDRMEGRFGKWKVSTLAIALLGVVFLLFAVNTTLLWSVAVIAIVAVLCKSSDGWKTMWLKAAGEADVPIGRATGAMFAVRSLALVAQPFILGALLGATDSLAVIVIGLICLACAGLFFGITRRSLGKS